MHDQLLGLAHYLQCLPYHVQADPLTFCRCVPSSSCFSHALLRGSAASLSCGCPVSSGLPTPAHVAPTARSLAGLCAVVRAIVRSRLAIEHSLPAYPYRYFTKFRLYWRTLNSYNTIMLSAKLIAAASNIVSYLFLDTFTDTNGVSLAAHMPNIGPAWSLLNNTAIEIQANRAHGKTLVNNQAVAVTDIGQADVYIECDLSALSTDPPGICLRVTDHLNYIMVRHEIGSGNLIIYENSGGTFTPKATVSVSLVHGDFYKLRVTTNGSAIVARVGSAVASTTSTLNQTATKHGLRARGTTLNQWDNISIYRYAGQDQIATVQFSLTDFTESGLLAARTNLTSRIWRTEGVLPTAGVGLTQVGATDPLTTSAAGLASVDKFTTSVGDATDRINYVWHPNTPNGKLVMYHYGHTSEDWNAGGKQVDFIHTLINAGYTVCGSQMPPGNTTGHNLYPAPNSSLNPLKYFVEDVIRCINELDADFDAIYMAGLSGGSWSTIVCAALDTRIKRCVHIDGDYPLFISEGSRDYEQFLPGVYPFFDYQDLYVMASSGERRQRQINVVSSGLFDKAAYDAKPYEVAVKARLSGGTFDISFDATTVAHEISAATRAAIIAFFDAA